MASIHATIANEMPMFDLLRRLRMTRESADDLERRMNERVSLVESRLSLVEQKASRAERAATLLLEERARIVRLHS